MVIIKTEKRDPNINPANLRKGGKLPAVYYGRKEKSTPITVSAGDFAKVFRAVGESSVVTLETEAGPLDSLIYDVDRDPLTGKFRHADFYVFEKGQKMKVKVPLEFSGVAPAVKELGGVLVKVLHELEIEAAPKDLPHHINVDITRLATFDSQILAKDMILPAGVILISNPLEVVASVYEPKEEVEEVVVAPDLSAIEVEKKGKEAKEGEEGAVATDAKAGGKEPVPAEKEKAKDKKK